MDASGPGEVLEEGRAVNALDAREALGCTAQELDGHKSYVHALCKVSCVTTRVCWSCSGGDKSLRVWEQKTTGENDPAEELGISLDRSPRAQIGYFPPAAVRHGKSPKCALGRLQLLHGRHQPDERIGYPRQPVGVVSFPRQPLEGWQQRCCAAEARRGAALPWRRSDGSIVAGPKTC